jgi:hypothetical protein
MSGTKILVVLLVLIAGIFLVAMYFGKRRSGEQGVDMEKARKGWAASLRKLFPREERLTMQEFKDADPASCLTSQGFTFLGSCTVSIAESEELLRKATFQLTSGVRAGLAYTPNEGPGLPRITLRQEKNMNRFDLTVRQEGGKLELLCLVGAGQLPCAVTLE